MTAVFHERLYGRYIEIQNNLRRKKLQRIIQGSNFFEDRFSKRDSARTPIQFGRESETTPVS